MRFTKMHGLGNDYLYVYGEVPENIAELSRRLSDRHFGVGSDGMIYISPSTQADFKMRIFNADGSEGMMCGNGIRCVGKYVYDKGYTDKTNLTIETLSGIKTLRMQVLSGKVKEVTVDMGTAEAGKDIKLNTSDLRTGASHEGLGARQRDHHGLWNGCLRRRCSSHSKRILSFPHTGFCSTGWRRAGNSDHKRPFSHNERTCRDRF